MTDTGEKKKQKEEKQNKQRNIRRTEKGADVRKRKMTEWKKEEELMKKIRRETSGETTK